MDIDFLDGDARRAATWPGDQPVGWTDDEVTRLCDLVQCIRAAQVPEDVLSLRFLRLRQPRDDPGRYLAALSERRAVGLTFKGESPPITVVDILSTERNP